MRKAIFATFLLISSHSFGNSNESREEKIKDIKQLIKLEKIDERVFRAAQVGFRQGRDEFLKGKEDLTAARIQKTNEFADKLVEKTYRDRKDDWDDKLNAEFIEIYDLNFSHNEIKDLLQFYKTPTGRKLLDKQETLINLSMSATESVLNWFALRIKETFKKAKKPTPE